MTTTTRKSVVSQEEERKDEYRDEARSQAARQSSPNMPKEAPKPEKKSARGRKPKKKADAPAEEVKAAEPTPIEEAVAQAAAPEVPAEAPASEAPATEAPAEAKAEEKKPEQAQGQGRHGRSKRRKITFGPGQDTKTVETVEEAPAAAEEEVPEVVLPVEIEIEGVLAINNNEGNKNDFCGFVHRNNYLPGEDDAYVPGQMIKRMGLRRGDYIKGFAIPKRGKDRYAPLKRITEVNGIPVIENEYDNIRRRPKFESLTAIYPDERLDLETEKEDISTRIIDLFSPELTYFSEISILPGQQGFFFDLTKIDKKRPQVIAAASRQYDEQTTDEGFRFICKSPLNTTNIVCLYLPKDYKSGHFTLTDAEGNTVNHEMKVITAPANTLAGRLFWLSFENSPDGINVQIKKN